MASVSKRKWTGKEGKVKQAWIVRYYDEQGRRRSKAFEQQKIADKYRLKIENDLAAGVHVASTEDSTVKDAAERFARHTEDRMRDGRIGRGQHSNVCRAIDISVVPLLGGLKMTDLSVSVVEKFYADMTRSGKLSPKTAKARVHLLGQIERYCLRRGEVKRAVVSEAAKELAGIPMSRIRTFSPTDALALLRTAAIRRPGRKHRPAAMLNCMVNIAAFCGLRFGELIGLKLENVDTANRQIRVRNSMTDFGELKGPKTRAGIRDVPMPSHVVRLVEQWIATHFLPNDLGLIFTSVTGLPISSGNFHRDQWQHLVRDTGLDGERRLHFHALRHFCASWMISNGIPVTDVARLLGHSHFDKTLQVYAHAMLDVSGQHDAIEAMSTRLLSRVPAALLVDPPGTHAPLSH